MRISCGLCATTKYELVYAGLPYSLRVYVYSPRATRDCQKTAGCFYSAAKRSSWLPGIYQACMHGRDELDSAARQISGCRFHGAAAETAAGFSAPRILSRSSWAGCSSAAAAAEPVAGGKVEGCDAGLDAAAAVAATAVDALAIRSCTNNDLVGNSQFWQPLQHSAADLRRVWYSL